MNKIKTSQAIEINANLDQRIKFLLNDYSKYIREENSFLELFKHAKNKVSSKTINNWLKLYKNKNWYKLAHYLIVDYYDPLYKHNLNKKNNKINEVTYEYLIPPCPPNERTVSKMLR